MQHKRPVCFSVKVINLHAWHLRVGKKYCSAWLQTRAGCLLATLRIVQISRIWSFLPKVTLQRHAKRNWRKYPAWTWTLASWTLASLRGRKFLFSGPPSAEMRVANGNQFTLFQKWSFTCKEDIFSRQSRGEAQVPTRVLVVNWWPCFVVSADFTFQAFYSPVKLWWPLISQTFKVNTVVHQRKSLFREHWWTGMNWGPLMGVRWQSDNKSELFVPSASDNSWISLLNHTLSRRSLYASPDTHPDIWPFLLQLLQIFLMNFEIQTSHSGAGDPSNAQHFRFCQHCPWQSLFWHYLNASSARREAPYCSSNTVCTKASLRANGKNLCHATLRLQNHKKCNVQQKRLP